MKLHRVAFAVVAALTLAAAGAVQAQARAGTAPFSRTELARIGRGELVVRPAARAVRGHRLVGGSSWIRTRVAPDVVYRAATDFGRWRRFVPRAVESRLVRHGARQNVAVRHAYGPVQASYELRVRTTPGSRDLRFTLDESRPHTIAAAWGYIRVIPQGSGSLVSYGIMVDVGDGVTRAMFEDQVQRWALRVPAELRRWVESREGRRRYGG